MVNTIQLILDKRNCRRRLRSRRTTMDRTSSHGSNSSAVAKQLEKLPPFKLCFSKDRLIGKSNIRVSKINGESITPKFYSKEYENRANNFNTIDTFEKSTEEQENSGNCSRRPPILLSSNAYGWWHERGLQPLRSRFDFHRKTSDLVNFGTNVRNEKRKIEN
ncbi:uncharacterized protein LOC117163543 [Bombus vancouverensis nearcticus]|uniref:uncharacterized protein LOC117163543 n=1 Tax=Bombus vancouverensis nearcticus TaxID=2705178 RepID=UPI00402B798E